MSRKSYMLYGGPAVALLIFSVALYIRNAPPSQSGQNVKDLDVKSSATHQRPRLPENDSRPHEVLVRFREAFISNSKSSIELAGLLSSIHLSNGDAFALIDEIGAVRIEAYLVQFGPGVYVDDNNQILYYALIDRMIDVDPEQCIEIVKKLNPDRLSPGQFSYLLSRASNDPSGNLLRKIEVDISPSNSWHQRIDSNMMNSLLRSGKNVSSSIAFLSSLPDGARITETALISYYMLETSGLNMSENDRRDLSNYLSMSSGVEKETILKKINSNKN